jgi:putative aldouronate transport system substrate-binding protein
MKRFLVFLLALAALVMRSPAMAEVRASGFPASDEIITIRAMTGTETLTPEDVNSMTIFKKAEENLNIRIEWITVPQGSAFNDKKSLMLATDDLPDFFYGGVTEGELVKYGAEGSFIPMEELWKGYAPNLSAILEKRPELTAFMTAPDGHIYGVPTITEGMWNQVSQIYNINTNWLEILGLPMPSNLAELEETLLAFKNGDPNGNGVADEIPMTFETGDTFSVYRFEYVFGAYQLPVSSSLLDVVDGKVVCVGTDERFKEGLKYVQRLYSEGLIDPDALVMDSSQWKAKINANPVIVGLSPNWDYNDNVSDPEINAQYGIMPPLKGADGSDPVVYGPAMYGYSRGKGVITKACQNPEAAMRWIDYWFDEINSYECSEGPIGERLFYDGNGTLLLGGADAVVGEILPRAQVCINPFANRALMKEYFMENRIAYPSTFPKVDFINSQIIQYVDNEPFNTKLYYSLDETELKAMPEVDVKSYINRKAGEWITGADVDAEWSTYLAELEKMGLSDYLAVQQGAYDRMTSE